MTSLSRRRVLGLLGVAGVGAAGLVELRRGAGSPGPPPKVAAGTTRLVETYGSGPRQLGEWWVPPQRTGLLPTVVLVHGGFWRGSYDLHLEDALAADLAGRGFLVWNIDYRPSEDPWPATLSDAAAYDFAFTGHYGARVDRARVAVVGHSAGGQLALWLASRDRLPVGAPGRRDHVRPALAVPQAPVAALAQASAEQLGAGAVDALLGGSPSAVPDRYAAADPAALVPSGVRTVLLHGAGDAIVPLSQSEEYLRVGGPQVSLEKVPGDHFVHLDPASAACDALRAALATL